jgi:co-chaperonin GroES (HSP10)
MISEDTEPTHAVMRETKMPVSRGDLVIYQQYIGEKISSLGYAQF